MCGVLPPPLAESRSERGVAGDRGREIVSSGAAKRNLSLAFAAEIW